MTPVRAVDLKALEGLPTGVSLKAKISKPRNRLVHRLYFAAIAAAAKHWPHGVEPEPEGDADRLRAWLQCKAGHAIRIVFPVTAKDAVIALIENMTSKDKYAFTKEGVIAGEPALAVFLPLSIDYSTLDEAEFAPTKTAVFEIIEATLGVTVKQLVEADDNET